MFLLTSREHMLKRIYHAIFVSNMKRGGCPPPSPPQLCRIDEEHKGEKLIFD